jgi:AcrR family transcriptional regulator
MEEVAVCAGVRSGLLHHYFGDKRGLYVEVVRDLLARFDDIIETSEHDGGGAGARDRSADASVGAGGGPAEGGDTTAIAPLVATHVDRWLGLVEQQADSWFALVDAEGNARDPEVRALVERAKGAMVEGIITALGLTSVTPELRSVLRSYSGLARVATHEWLKRENLTRQQVQALLSTSLVAMARDVTPAVETAADAGGASPARPRRGRPKAGPSIDAFRNEARAFLDAALNENIGNTWSIGRGRTPTDSRGVDR